MVPCEINEILVMLLIPSIASFFQFPRNAWFEKATVLVLWMTLMDQGRGLLHKNDLSLPCDLKYIDFVCGCPDDRQTTIVAFRGNLSEYSESSGTMDQTEEFRLVYYGTDQLSRE